MITIQRAQALLGVELARKILTIRYLTLRGRAQQITPFLHTFDALLLCRRQLNGISGLILTIIGKCTKRS